MGLFRSRAYWAGVVTCLFGMGAAVVIGAHVAGNAGTSQTEAPTFTCTVTRVHDGDGPIWCAERGADGKPIKVRLHAIAARELDGSCSDGHPCPEASGVEAQRALARLAMDSTLRCEATGTSYGRVTAWCWRPDGIELNCAMVEGGHALRWPEYDRSRRLCRK